MSHARLIDIVTLSLWLFLMWLMSWTHVVPYLTPEAKRIKYNLVKTCPSLPKKLLATFSPELGPCVAPWRHPLSVSALVSAQRSLSSGLRSAVPVTLPVWLLVTSQTSLFFLKISNFVFICFCGPCGLATLGCAKVWSATDYLSQNVSLYLKKL